MKISAANLPHLIATAAILAAIAAPAAIANAATSPRDTDALAKATYIYIATVRKDGNQSKAAPVWFITTADHQVLIETSPTSWKAKRIKRGSPAMIWIGARTGPAFIGKAEIVTDTKLQDQVIAEYPKKYLLARIGFARPSRAKLDSGPNRRHSYFAGARFARRISICARNARAALSTRRQSPPALTRTS